jgi:hypothetical protein
MKYPLICMLTLLWMATSTAHAARLLVFTIVQNGQVQFRGHASDDGMQPPEKVLSLICNVGFSIVPGAKLPLSSPTSVECQLQGKNLVVIIKHADNTLVEMEVSSLILARQDTSSREWKLAPGEYEKLAARVQSGVPLQPSSQTARWMWIVVVAFIVIALIAVLRQRRQSQTTLPAS